MCPARPERSPTAAAAATGGTAPPVPAGPAANEAASGPEPRGTRAPASALAGAWATAGWLLADLAVFLSRGAHGAAVELAPEGLAAVVLGAALGALLSGPTRAATALAVVGLAATASLAVRLPLAPTALVGLRVLLLWLLAWAATRTLARRTAGQLGLLGLAAGLCAAVLQTAARHGLTEALERALWAAVGLGAAAAGLRWLASRRPRTPGLALAAARWALAALIVGWLLWPGLAEAQRLRRFGRAPLGPPGAAPAAGVPSLLLVVLDTVRADRLGCYGHHRDTTPNLDAFAADATRYTQARSTSSWTLPSHASLFTGLLPAQHGATHPRAGADEDTLAPAWPAQPLRADVPTLAERLRALGLDTAAVVANPLYLRHDSHLDRGFAHYDDRDPPPLLVHYQALPQLLGRKVWLARRGYRDARAITDLALDWLDHGRSTADGAARPFFLMLNYMDAHWPYVPPAPHDRAFSVVRPENPLRPPEVLHELLYDRELAYLDAQVGRLLEGLEERGLLDDLAVVITSDHGEAFGEHGFWKHDWTLYDEVVRVPLLVRLPGRAGGDTDDEPIHGAEVHDLMLRALGLEPEPRPAAPVASVASEWYRVDDDEAWERRFGGVDLDRDLVAWVEGGTKWVVSTNGEVQAFALADDPLELAPLSLDDAAREAARARAEAWWSTHPPPPTRTGTLDEETRRKMRALGYLDGGDEGTDAGPGERAP